MHMGPFEMWGAVYNSFYAIIMVVFYSLSTPHGLGACDTRYLNQSFNQSLFKCPCVTCVCFLTVSQWDAGVGQCPDPLPVSCQWEQSGPAGPGQQTGCPGWEQHSAYSKQRSVCGGNYVIWAKQKWKSILNIKILIKVHLNEVYVLNKQRYY